MVGITWLPEGLKKLTSKKNDPSLIGCVPPVRFFNKYAGEKLTFVKIMFSKSVTKYYEMFITGDMEVETKRVIVHETMLTNLKPEDQVKTNTALVTVKLSRKATLSN